MHRLILDFDAVLKLLIQGGGGESLGLLRLIDVGIWLNPDLPSTQHRRADLLYRAIDDHIVHIEIQSTNDPTMPYRMAEYGLAIMRTFHQFPEQVVLYVGNEPMRMKSGFRAGGMSYECRLVDIRDLDGRVLLASNSIADNTLALLTRMDDSASAIRSVLGRIVKLENPARAEALELFLLTCGLRGFEEVATEELRTMPVSIQYDLTKYPIFGDLYRKGLAKGLKKGRQEGKQEGEDKGREAAARELLSIALNKRFGRVPAYAAKRIDQMSAAQAKKTLSASFDAKKLRDLFPPTRAR